MRAEKPFFTIITVSFNAEDTIAQTVNSALNQTFEDFEIVVKDGLSKDQTVSRIPSDSRIQVYSESDHGIYDAMNAGIARAEGKYLIFMNCGDLFASETVLAEIHDLLVKEDYPGVLYGDYAVDHVRCVQGNHLTRFYLYRTPLCHQTMVIAKAAFEEHGLYDCKYRILADYDFTLRCWMSGVRFVHSDTVICNYLGGGVSESKKGAKIKEVERKEIVKKHYGAWERFRYDLILFMTLRKLRMWLFSNSCPRFIRSAYRKFVNRLNTK